MQSERDRVRRERLARETEGERLTRQSYEYASGMLNANAPKVDPPPVEPTKCGTCEGRPYHEDDCVSRNGCDCTPHRFCPECHGSGLEPEGAHDVIGSSQCGDGVMVTRYRNGRIGVRLFGKTEHRLTTEQAWWLWQIVEKYTRGVYAGTGLAPSEASK